MTNYLVGFAKTSNPLILINPKLLYSVLEVFDWLTSHFNELDYQLDKPISMVDLYTSLNLSRPVQINIEGYPIVMIIGSETILKDNGYTLLNEDSVKY